MGAWIVLAAAAHLVFVPLMRSPDNYYKDGNPCNNLGMYCLTELSDTAETLIRTYSLDTKSLLDSYFP